MREQSTMLPAFTFIENIKSTSNVAHQDGLRQYIYSNPKAFQLKTEQIGVEYNNILGEIYWGVIIVDNSSVN